MARAAGGAAAGAAAGHAAVGVSFSSDARRRETSDTWTRSLHFRRVCVCAWYRSWFYDFYDSNEQTNERTNDDDDDADADAVFREKNGVRRALARVRYALFSALFSRRRRRLERLHAREELGDGAQRRRQRRRRRRVVAFDIAARRADIEIGEHEIRRECSAVGDERARFRRDGASEGDGADGVRQNRGRGAEGDPKPGEGPSKEERESGFFDLAFIGLGEGGERLTVAVTGDKDPGYGCTSKMIGESAVCLITEATDTPGGVWTPGAAMGMKLVERLRANAGMTFEVEA